MKPNRRVADNGYEVLIVEDSPTQAMQLEHLLRQRGYEVRTAANGREALSVIEERKPSIVVSDIQMPGMDGYELCRTIKSRKEWSDLPVVLLTALATPQHILDGLKSGADNFICKPYDDKYLCLRLGHILTNQKLRKQDKMHFGVELELGGQRHFLTAERHQILDLLISTAQEAARANESLNERHRELEESQRNLHLLYELAGALNKSTALSEVVQAVLQFTVQLPLVAAVWISLVGEDGGFHVVGSSGLPAALKGPGVLDGDCLCRQKVLAGELKEATNIYDCERLRSAASGAQSLRHHATVMLKGTGAPLGLLNLATREGRLFSAQQLRILEGMGYQIGAALERARLLERLEELVEQRTAVLRAEVATREQAEENLKNILESTPDALVGVSGDGRIVMVNAQAEKLFSYTREELLGQPLELLVPDRFRKDHVGHRTAYSSDPVPRPMGANLDLHGLRKDGQEFPIEVSLSTLKGGKGALTLSTIRDIAERKQLERQLRMAQKMESVGLLAGGVAHDFNNLLTIILGNCDFLLEELASETGSRRRVKEVRQAGERAASLTRQLLAFSGKQVLHPQVLNPNTIVSEMAKMLRRLIGEHITLATVLGPETGNVKVDSSQLEQIIMNLAVNARDAMSEGGTLTIETRNVELDEAYARTHANAQPGSYVLLAVSDTGVGMDQQVLSRIFEPFFTTKESGKGTGLGLATVYGLVKQNGGNIWVYSEPGHGTTFKIYLRRVKEQAAVVDEGVESELPRGSETVLLAEDAEPIRMLAREFLESLGYAVLEAGNGAEALAIATKYPGQIHLLLTDVVMPQMMGTDLAKQLAAQRPEMKVLYMSGYTPESVNHKATFRSEEFIEKPFRKQMLAKKLRNLLEKHTKAAKHEWQKGTLPDLEGVAPGNQPESSVGPDVAIDLSALKSLVGEDLTLQRRFLRKFSEAARVAIQDIHAARASRSAPDIAMAAHKLKSSARTAGATVLADVCESLEQAGKTDDWEEIDRLEPRLDELMAGVRDQVNRLLPSLGEEVRDNG